jgi:hypothetical protein
VTELECQQSDLMYASLTFEDPWDSNNDNVDDTFPGLLNVNTIQMAPPSDSDGDDIDDVFPGLLNVSTLAMAAPPADGTAQITNILSLSCATGNTVSTETDRFNVDCPTTQMQGLVVTSDAEFDSNVTVASQLVVGPTPAAGPASASAVGPTTGEIILNGENLAGKFMTRLSHTFSGEDFLTVNKPDCPDDFDQDISIMPVAFNLPELPEDTTQDLLGVNTEFTTVGETWQVKLKLLVKTVDNDEIEEGEAITQTLTNPTGSKVVVLTGCSP